MEWNRENTINFIKQIKDRPVIWDISAAEHKNKSKRHEAFDEVSKLLGITVKEVITKWTSLRGQFVREKKRLTGLRARNKGSDKKTSIIKWFAYNEMKSLMVGNKPHKTFSYLENSMDNKFLSPVVPVTFQIQPETMNPQPVVATTPIIKSVIVTKDMIIQPKKKKNTGLCSESTLNVINDSKKHVNPEDSLTTFASYIIAQVRQFHPRLQIKAKYEINQLLYQLEMENHEMENHEMENHEMENHEMENQPHPHCEREQDSSTSNYSNFNTEPSSSPYNENYSSNIIYLGNVQSPQIHPNTLIGTVQIGDQNAGICLQPDPLNNIAGCAINGTCAIIKRE